MRSVGLGTVSGLCFAVLVLAARPADAQPVEGGDGPPDLEVAVRGAEGVGADEELPREIRLREFLVLPRVDLPGRRPLHRDPIDAAIASGEWKRPAIGDTVRSAAGDRVKWSLGIANARGRLSGPATGGGYALAVVDSPADRVMLLDAAHHAAVRVNDDWLAGDPYAEGGPLTPVRLVEGENALLFHIATPGFEARLVAPEAGVVISTDDATLPDIVVGESKALWAALPVVNAAESALVSGELRVTIGQETSITKVPTIGPLTLHKVAFRLPKVAAGAAGEAVVVQVALHRPRRDTGTISPDPSATAEFTLRRVAVGAPHVRTFVSRVDGSVQPYSVVPAAGASGGERPGVVLALHDLGVDHRQFAKNFAAKDWAHVVVPQNRRAIGFAWEDWGARDAIEALDDARRHLDYDPQRCCVTGHGFGGYGAWRLATQFPDRFAAVGPSCANVMLGAPPAADAAGGSVAALLERSLAARGVAPTLRNLSPVGVYLLHGADDQRAPAAESRFMRSRLGEFHPDFVYYERPNVGHWWGKETADWPAMNDFFRDRRLPTRGETTRVDFTTLHPSSSARCQWATVERQEQECKPARVVLEHDPDQRTFRGRTENVAALSLGVVHMRKRPGTIRITLDGGKTLDAPWANRAVAVTLDKDEEGRWRLAGRQVPTAKTARRGGLFKSVFDGRPLLVYSTQGDDAENAWSESKARFDSQSFWRRGNASLEVIADVDFDASAEPNRNVILYGNAQTNAAWPRLLSTSPVQLRRGEIAVGVQANVRPELGEDLALLMVRPRPGSRSASVGVVGGTGIHGMRLTDRMRYFVAGVNYPDLVILGPRFLVDGAADVRAAGYFGADWGVATGELLWRDLAL